MSKRKAKVVEKDWGREIWMANNQEEDYCGKILQINQGYNTSLHFHLEKHETFYKKNLKSEALELYISLCRRLK